MFLLIIFIITCQLTFGAQVPVCKAVNYSGIVVEKDANLTTLATLYTYNLKLKVAVNAENVTYPNIITVSDFEDWSLNNTSTSGNFSLFFVATYYWGDLHYVVNCTYFNETCVFSFPNGQISRFFKLNYGDHGGVDIYDRPFIFVNGGVLFGGDQGYVMDQANPCINGETDSFGVFPNHYAEANATVCCVEYDYVEVPDKTEHICQEFASMTTILDDSQNFSLDLNFTYNISFSKNSYTNISINTKRGQIWYSNFVIDFAITNLGICSDSRGPWSVCQALLSGHQNLQWNFVFNLHLDGYIINYVGIILGEINRQNGTYFKNNFKLFSPNDPCSYKSSGVAFSNATYNSSFCCTKFKEDTTGWSFYFATRFFDGKSFAESSRSSYFVGRPPCTTTKTSIITTAITTVPTTVSRVPLNYIGAPCSTDISQAWLDIVFVVDTSKLMTKPQLQQLSAQISTYMQSFTFAQIGQHTVRAAIIVYATQVTTIYQLTDTSDFDAFVDAIYALEDYANPDDEGGNLQGALQAAYNLSISQKSQRRPLIVLIAAAYNTTGFQGADLTANTIKANGICIVVINFKSSQGVLATALQNISCSGYYYISDNFDLESKFRFALTQLNCICPQGSLQFREYNTAWQNYTNYADCLYGYQTPTAPKFAERSCTPGTLAAVTSQSKLDFITDNVLPYVMPKEKKFTIGLHKSDIDGEWNWWGYNKTEYPLGEYPAMADPPAVGDNYGYMWNHYGFNWTLQTGNNIPLPYICQSRACDAEFICDMTPAKSVLRD